MIPAANVTYLWDTVVIPRLGTVYQWGTFDCSMAVSQELEAMLYGPAMTYGRQFTTMSFAAVQPGAHGPFDGIASTTDLVCIASPTDAPADAAMIIAIIQDPNPEDAHMICRVPGNLTGVDIEMGGESNDYHTSTSDSTCASVYDTTEFDQWLYLPGPIKPGDPVTLFGTDVANVNFGGEDDPDLDAVAAFVNALPGEGFSWLEFKATQGSNFIDPCWETAYQTAQAINFPIVAYHYIDESDATAQAQNAASVPAAFDVGWMFDWEDGGGDGTNLNAVYEAFITAGLKVVLIYPPDWYWAGTGQTPDLSVYPVGIVSSDFPDADADYASNLYTAVGGDDGAGWQDYANISPVIWQFTDNAIIAGINVDADAFVGTEAELLTLLGITPAPVPPPAPPAPPVPAPSSNAPAIPKPSDEATQVSELWDQELIRWDMLNGRTVVEALADIGAKLGLPYTPPSPEGSNS
jgi:Glycosyl hydrolases family 25